MPNNLIPCEFEIERVHRIYSANFVFCEICEIGRSSEKRQATETSSLFPDKVPSYMRIRDEDTAQEIQNCVFENAC